MWTAVQNVDIPIYYKRRIFEAADPDFAGTFAVDFVVPPYNADRDQSLPNRTAHYKESEFVSLGSNDEKPMLVCLHGLSGGSYEIYLRAVLQPLIENGWEGCVVNSRGCAMSPITTGVLYNARATWDVRQMVKWIRTKWPNRKLYGIGFSLGANILTNYVGEEGDECILEAAVVCSNPWTLDVANLALQRSWIGKEVYSKAMGSNMRKLFEDHMEQLKKNPRIDVEEVQKIKYLHEFDRALQGPTWGYPTEGAYYRDASSVDALFNIRIPFLSINAEDDPIAHLEAIPFEEFKQNPYTVLLTSSLGGHLSWFEIGGTRWFAKPASNFLMKIAERDTEIFKPNIVAGPTSKELGIAGKPPPFLPMRRKLRMSMDD
ncbi:MAG: hypothetical protein MMC23_007286 [Stictis urceolatum]|nr:hypothetical protein [Stictis urceolata]